MSSARDLLTHLVPCPLTVTYAGRDFTIPAMDAVAWLRILAVPQVDLYSIFPDLAGVDAVEHVEDVLWADPDAGGQVGDLGKEIISAVGDRPWWVVMRIIGVASQAWDRVHVNQAAGMSLAGWLDEVWTKILTYSDPKKLTGWIAQVEQAPRDVVQVIDFDAEEQAFLNAMNAVMK